ncbi:hypothetical protein P8452_14289 [Trifolium repens]|nr:hypothetical protein P8452_14289 [Trifolium repens]
MVHGILQFTPSIAFRYVLHRCKSLDIRCRESFYIMCQNTTRTKTVSGAMQVRSEQILNSLTHSAPGFVFWHKGERTTSSSSEPEASRGSPTETLLRLLLPLNDKVQWTSHNVAGSEPPTSPQSEHFTGPFNR